MPTVFISYSRVDEIFVKELYTQLENNYGVGTVWYDKDIPGGADFWYKIQQEIHNADIFLYLMSPESIKSEWCDKEFAEAISLNKIIIPIIVRARTPITQKVQHLNVLNMSSGVNNSDTLTKLYSSLNPYIYTNYLPSEASSSSSTSFSDQKKLSHVNPTWLILLLLFLVGGILSGLFIVNQNNKIPPISLAYEFLVDTSATMGELYKGKPRIKIVEGAIEGIIRSPGISTRDTWRALRTTGGWECNATELVVSGNDVSPSNFMAKFPSRPDGYENSFAAGLNALHEDLSQDIPIQSDIRVAFFFLGSLDNGECPEFHITEQLELLRDKNISATSCIFFLGEPDEEFQEFTKALESDGLSCIHNVNDPKAIANIAINTIQDLILREQGIIQDLTPVTPNEPNTFMTTPSSTLTSEATIPPTFTPNPPQSELVNAVIYIGQSEGDIPVSTLIVNENITIIGISPDANWVQVVRRNGDLGWVATSELGIEIVGQTLGAVDTVEFDIILTSTITHITSPSATYTPSTAHTLHPSPTLTETETATFTPTLTANTIATIPNSPINVGNCPYLATATINRIRVIRAEEAQSANDVGGDGDQVTVTVELGPLENQETVNIGNLQQYRYEWTANLFSGDIRDDILTISRSVCTDEFALLISIVEDDSTETDTILTPLGEPIIVPLLINGEVQDSNGDETFAIFEGESQDGQYQYEIVYEVLIDPQDGISTSDIDLTPSLPGPVQKVDSYCPNVLESRFENGISGYVSFNLGLAMRSAPEGAELMKLDFGSHFSVIGGPICQAETRWWKIQLDNGDEGWLAEGIDYYFIAPESLERAELPIVYDEACPNAPDYQLSVGSAATVLLGNRFFLRDESEVSQMNPLSQGTHVYILGGPRCTGTDESSWSWYIRVIEEDSNQMDVEGWLVEVNTSSRNLEPIPIPTLNAILTQAPTPTRLTRSNATSTPGPTPTPLICNGSLPTQLYTGMYGWVIPDGISNRVRTEPTVSGNQVALLEPGGIFEVVGGPECGDEYAWIQVEFNGIVGWTAIGGLEEDWVEPLPGNAAYNGDSCFIIANGSVNGRKAANTVSPVSLQLQKGEILDVIGKTVDSTGFVWWKLSDMSWVREDTVDTIGDCIAIEIIES